MRPSHRHALPVLLVWAAFGAYVSGVSADERFKKLYQPSRLSFEGLGDPRLGRNHITVVPGIIGETTEANMVDGTRRFRLNISTERVHPIGRFPFNQWLAQRKVEDVALQTGPIELGQVLPFFGALYRVERVTPDRFKGALVNLVKVSDEDCPEIRLDPFAYDLTVGGRMRVSSLHEKSGVFLEYDSIKKSLEMTIVNPYMVHPRKTELDVKVYEPIVGDVFHLSSGLQFQPYKIIEVVSPEPSKNINGWVSVRRIWPEIPAFPATGRSKE